MRLLNGISDSMDMSLGKQCGAMRGYELDLSFTIKLIANSPSHEILSSLD